MAYVATSGTDAATCTLQAPCRTIGFASMMLAARHRIHILGGTYEVGGAPAIVGTPGLLIDSSSAIVTNSAAAMPVFATAGGFSGMVTLANMTLGVQAQPTAVLKVNTGMILVQHAHLLQPFDNSTTLTLEDSQLDNTAASTSTGATIIRRSVLTGQVTCSGGTLLYQQSSFVGALAVDALSPCAATIENSKFFTNAPGGPVLKLSETSKMRFDTVVAGQATSLVPVQGYGAAGTTIDSCIFAWNATAPTTSVTTYSLFNGLNPPVGTGNQAHDVSSFFVDPANGDFHLKAGSPAIHGADPSDTLNVDIDGTSRPSPAATASDVGAYESPQ